MTIAHAEVLYTVNTNGGFFNFVGLPNIGDALFSGIDVDPATNTLYQTFTRQDGTGSYGYWEFDDLGFGTYHEILVLEDFENPTGGIYWLKIAIEPSSLSLGDVNGDDEVNLLDVAPFVTLVVSAIFRKRTMKNVVG